MRWLGRGKFGLFRSQRGFSLIETIVAVVIIGFIGAGVVMALDTNARAGRVLDEQVVATNLVTAYLEGIRQMPYSDNTSPYSSVGDNITKPAQYSVTVNIYYSLDGVNWVTTHDNDEKLQRIGISVSRTSGKLVLSTCTFRANR